MQVANNSWEKCLTQHGRTFLHISKKRVIKFTVEKYMLYVYN